MDTYQSVTYAILPEAWEEKESTRAAILPTLRTLATRLMRLFPKKAMQKKLIMLDDAKRSGKKNSEQVRMSKLQLFQLTMMSQ